MMRDGVERIRLGQLLQYYEGDAMKFQLVVGDGEWKDFDEVRNYSPLLDGYLDWVVTDLGLVPSDLREGGFALRVWIVAPDGGTEDG